MIPRGVAEWPRLGVFLGSLMTVVASGLLAPAATYAGPSGTAKDLSSVEAPAPPLPGSGFAMPVVPIEAGSHAGYLPGRLNVGSNGALEYKIPLDAPPGPAGMAPALALEYSSASGNGILGVGWHVSGAMSSITPCGRTFEADGAQTGVHFTAVDKPEQRADRYCLDGAKLVAIEGDYGAPGTEYRTEADQGLRVISEGGDAEGPETFKVWTSDGKFHVYEAVRAQRYLTTSNGAASPESVRVMWVRTRQEDRSGNVITFSYQISRQTNDAPGPGMGTGIEIVPWRIDYSVLDDDSPVVDFARRRYIEFEYSRCDGSTCARPDRYFQYAAGVRFDTTKRLQAIRMFGPRPDSTAELWSYRFDYETGATTKRSRLTGVKKCGHLGGCLLEKHFRWSEDRPTFDQDLVEPGFNLVLCKTSMFYMETPCPHASGEPMDNSISAEMIVPADLNGDGADDLIYEPGSTQTQYEHYVRLSALSTSGNNTIQPLADRRPLMDVAGYDSRADFNERRVLGASRIADVDGDGQMELWAVRVQIAEHVASADLFHWDPATDTFIKGASQNSFQDLHEVASPMVDLVDVNGDGHLDTIAQTYAGHRIELNDAGTAFCCSTETTLATRTYLDVDGDGKTDFGTSRVNDAGELEKLPFHDDYPVREEYPTSASPDLQFGDFNGDGLMDAAQVTWGPVDPAIHIRWNTGRGFGPKTLFAQLPLWPDVAMLRDRGLRVADMDGDGRQDFILFHEVAASTPWSSNDRGMTILYAHGERAHYPGVGHRVRGVVPYNGVQDGDYSFTKLGDFNGDGRTDIVSADVLGNNTSLVVYINGPEPGTAGAIPDSPAGSPSPGGADLLYAVYEENSAWDSEVVTFGSFWGESPRLPGVWMQNCTYPVACVHPGMTVVRRVVSRAHLVDPDSYTLDHEARTIDYSYERPKVDLRGRGYMHFELVRSWDRQRAREVLMWYGPRVEGGGTYDFTTSPSRVQVVTRIESTEAPTSSARVRVVDTTAQFELKTLHAGKVHVVRPVQQITREWEQDAGFEAVLSPGNESRRHFLGVAETPVPQRTTTVGLVYEPGDLYNLVKSQTTAIDGGMSQTVSFSYEHRPQDWLIGLPVGVDIARWSPETGQGARSLTRSYDSRGRLKTTTIQGTYPNPDIPETTELVYTANGNIAAIHQTASVDGVSETRTVRFDYDPLYPGAPQEKIYASTMWAQRESGLPVLAQWAAVHPGYGVRVASLDVNGNTTRSRYDDLGRPVEEQVPGNAPVRHAYEPRPDAAGGWNGVRVTNTQSTGGGTSQREIIEADQLGRVVRQVARGFDGGDVERLFSYDALGRLDLISRPFAGQTVPQFSSTVYDNLDRPLRSFDADSNLVHEYTYAFFETRVANANGHVTTQRRNKDEQIIEVVAPDSTTTSYGYGPFGELVKIEDAEGNTTSMKYDVRGRLIEYVDPDRGTEKTYYNGFGEIRRVRHVESDGNLLFKYDDLGRLVERTSEDGVDTYTWDMADHGIGRLAATESAFGITTSYGYDGLGRSVSTIYGVNGETFGFDMTFDGLGRPKTLAYPDAGSPHRFVIEHGFNALGFLERVDNKTQGQPATNYWKVLARDAEMHLLQAGFGSGAMLSRDYHPVLGRLQQVAVTSLSNVKLLDLNYEYDPQGLVKRRRELVSGRDEWFGYDTRSRLDQWTFGLNGDAHIEQYGYDTIGNLREVRFDGTLRETRQFGAPDGTQPHALREQIFASSVQSYDYDKRGRLAEGGGRGLVYTAFDLPKQVTTANGTKHYGYDAFGNLVVTSTQDAQSITLAGLYERRSDGGGVSHVYHLRVGEGADVRVARPDQTDNLAPTYQVRDNIESNVLALDAAGGSVPLFYDPWGRRTAADGSAVSALDPALQEGFSSKRHDPTTGLVDFGGRVYDAAMRTFLTVDPLVSNPFVPDALNPYSYVMYSPLNLTDPSGFNPCSATASFEYEGATYSDTWSTGLCTDGTGEISTSGLATMYSNEIPASQRFDATSSQQDSPFGPGSMGSPEPGVSNHERAFSKGGEWNAGDRQAWGADRFNRNFPIIGPLFDGPYPDTPAWRERNADLAIQQNGAMELLGMGPLFLRSPVRARPRTGRPAANQSAYRITHGTNPSGCEVNCAGTSLAGLQRVTGMNPTAVAEAGRSEIKIYGKLYDEVVKLFGEARVTDVELASLRDAVQLLRHHPEGTSAIMLDSLRVGSTLVTKEGHYVVARVDKGGVIRFFDFQKEGPAKSFIPDSTLRLMSSEAGDAHVVYGMIIVEP